MRFNPPPGWPPPPPGFVPGPAWRPDPRWPLPPPGWQLWVQDEDERDPGQTAGYRAYPAQSPSASPHSHRRPAASARTTQLTGSPSWERASPPPSGTSGMAIAAFVLGLLGVVILGVIFGVIALRRIGRTHQAGKGLAVAGIALSVAWVAVAVVLAVVAGSLFGTATPASPGVAASLPPGASGQSVDPFTLTAGDCFDNPTPTAGQTQTVTAVVQT